MSDDLIYSRRGSRTLSPFLAHELLYDYATDNLDQERKTAVENYLRDNKEAQDELKKIRLGLSYALKLQGINISAEIVHKVQEPTSYIQILLSKIHFSEWPSGLKMALEALVVTIGIASVALLIPWHRLKEIQFGGNRAVILAELSRQYENNQDVETELPKTEEEVFPDEGKPTTTVAVTTTQKGTTTSSTTTMVLAAIPEKKTTTSSTTTTTLSVAVSKSPLTSNPVLAIPGVVPSPVVPGSLITADPSATEAKRVGFLYRGTISINNVAAINPKIVEKIDILGGRKAGEVPIGWRKGNGSYYHFTIPESRYNEVVSTFEEYGPLKISKEKHERIMPEGIIRIIITVEEAYQPKLSPTTTEPEVTDDVPSEAEGQ